MRFGLALVCAALIPAAAAAQGSAKFDGNWSVQVLTEKGDCEKVYRYPIVVQNGVIRYGGPEGFAASGNIGSNGAVRGRISRGDRRADVTGRVSGVQGGGTWKTSTGCSGQWSAEKRG